MTTTEDRARAAMRAIAGTVNDAPPLRLEAARDLTPAPDGARLGWRRRGARHGLAVRPGQAAPPDPAARPVLWGAAGNAADGGHCLPRSPPRSRSWRSPSPWRSSGISRTGAWLLLLPQPLSLALRTRQGTSPWESPSTTSRGCRRTRLTLSSAAPSPARRSPRSVHRLASSSRRSTVRPPTTIRSSSPASACAAPTPEPCGTCCASPQAAPRPRGSPRCRSRSARTRPVPPSPPTAPSSRSPCRAARPRCASTRWRPGRCCVSGQRRLPVS